MKWQVNSPPHHAATLPWRSYGQKSSVLVYSICSVYAIWSKSQCTRTVIEPPGVRHFHTARCIQLYVYWLHKFIFVHSSMQNMLVEGVIKKGWLELALGWRTNSASGNGAIFLYAEDVFLSSLWWARLGSQSHADWGMVSLLPPGRTACTWRLDNQLDLQQPKNRMSVDCFAVLRVSILQWNYDV